MMVNLYRKARGFKTLIGQGETLSDAIKDAKLELYLEDITEEDYVRGAIEDYDIIEDDNADFKSWVSSKGLKVSNIETLKNIEEEVK